MPTEQQDRDLQALTDWWMDHAAHEADRTLPKAVEYGSEDLREIGRTLAYILDRDVTDQEAVELGIFFYHVGKTARWVQAVKDDRQVSDDTLFDAGVYVRMAQRNRAVGGWPWAPNPDKHETEL